MFTDTFSVSLVSSHIINTEHKKPLGIHIWQWLAKELRRSLTVIFRVERDQELAVIPSLD